MNMKPFTDNYCQEYTHTLANLDIHFIETLTEHINQARESNHALFTIGNGGSAASASHWVCDFSKNITINDQQRLRIMSLSDNAPVFSALGNDIAFEDVFAEQLKNQARPGDIVLAMSVSGASPNLVKAIDYAYSSGITVFSIIGAKNGIMHKYSHHTLVVPSFNYGIVEDVHMYVCHVISQFLKMKAEGKNIAA